LRIAVLPNGRRPNEKAALRRPVLADVVFLRQETGQLV
jgi:hypothetical protein